MARFRLFFGGLFSDHAHAKRTARGDGLGPGLLQLAVAVGAHPLGSFFFLLPKLSAAGAAAKAIARELRSGSVSLAPVDWISARG